MQPLISVIIPNYNYGRYISESINSVLGQSYKSIECIVVDDGSTDNSVDVICSFGDRVKLICQENSHQAAARNKGIKAASGEWIAFLDSDDIWHPMKLEIQMRILSLKPEWQFIGADFAIDTKFQNMGPELDIKEICLKDVLTSTPLSPSNLVVKADCLDITCLFDEDPIVRGVEDKDLWLRLVARFRGGKVHSQLCYYRLHQAQENRRVDSMIKGEQIILERFFNTGPQFSHYKYMAYSHHHYMAGISLRDDAKQSGKSIIHFIKSLLFCPNSYNDKITTLLRLKSLAVAIAELVKVSINNNSRQLF